MPNTEQRRHGTPGACCAAHTLTAHFAVFPRYDGIRQVIVLKLVYIHSSTSIILYYHVMVLIDTRRPDVSYVRVVPARARQHSVIPR